MSVQGTINDAARRYLRAMDLDVDEVLKVEQRTQQSGFCDTCRHDEIVVNIIYLGREGDTETHTYYGDLGVFIRALDATDEEARR